MVAPGVRKKRWAWLQRQKAAKVAAEEQKTVKEEAPKPKVRKTKINKPVQVSEVFPSRELESDTIEEKESE